METPLSPQLTLVLATRNAHKVSELGGLLVGVACCVSLAAFPTAPEVVEDAATFAGNATKKVVALADWLASLPESPAHGYVLADDSGLEVDALDGAPGVLSARFAALDTNQPGNSPDAANNAKLLRLLAAVPAARRTARFRCVLALAPIARDAAARVNLFDGVCEGAMAFTPRGTQGFGYDPLFVPRGYERTFAELGEDVKNTLSHRAKALAQLRAWLAAGASPYQPLQRHG